MEADLHKTVGPQAYSHWQSLRISRFEQTILVLGSNSIDPHD